MPKKSRSADKKPAANPAGELGVDRPGPEQPSPKELEEKLARDREATYEANKELIETALRQCCSHLKKLKLRVALETIRRLQVYYELNGIEQPPQSAERRSLWG